MLCKPQKKKTLHKGKKYLAVLVWQQEAEKIDIKKRDPCSLFKLFITSNFSSITIAIE